MSFWNIPEHFMNVTIFSLSLGDTLYSLYNKEVEFVGLQCFSVG